MLDTTFTLSLLTNSTITPQKGSQPVSFGPKPYSSSRQVRSLLPTAARPTLFQPFSFLVSIASLTGYIGGETTSTALSALFFYLARNPDIYKNLANEIRSTFSNDTEIQGGSKLRDCRYMRACIDEALRMSPPVSGTPWRELYPDQKDQTLIIDGHVVPPETQVGVCFYSLHHNDKYFSDPFIYRPERWLVDDEEQLRVMNSAFCAFSVGPRGCAGKAMAYLEASLVVAKTIWAFDFKLAPSGRSGGGGPHKREGRRREDEFQLYDIFASMHVGPELIFTPRLSET